jgi:hypothetical protein
MVFNSLDAGSDRPPCLGAPGLHPGLSCGGLSGLGMEEREPNGRIRLASSPPFGLNVRFEDMKMIDMPPPASDSGNVYARGMSAILSYLGADMTYDQVMGLSGVAFILQVDTSGPNNEWGLDCAWWPNGDWGFELGLPVLARAAGWEVRKTACDFQAYKKDPAAEYRLVFQPLAEESLRANRPVLAYGFVGTATDDEEPPLLGFGTSGKSTQYAREPGRAESYPWHLYTIDKKIPVGRAKDVDLASMRYIIALFNERAQGADAPATRFSGRQAWKEWTDLLHSGTGCDNNMLIHLRYCRSSAVAYLKEMARRHAGEVAEHLSSASDIYQRILDDLNGQDLPMSRVNKGEDRDAVSRDYTAMVERVSKLEAEAIAEIKAAAASLGD